MPMQQKYEENVSYLYFRKQPKENNEQCDYDNFLTKSSLGSFLEFSFNPQLFINTFYCCRDCILGSEVERLSFCELEVDILASDILNKLEIGGKKLKQIYALPVGGHFGEWDIKRVMTGTKGNSEFCFCENLSVP